MKIHPREKIVIAASLEYQQLMIQLFKNHPDLTYGEWFTILAEEISRSSKYAVRAERVAEDDDWKGEPMCGSCHGWITNSPAGGCKTPGAHR